MALPWPDPAPRRDLVYSGFLTRSHHGPFGRCQKTRGIWQPRKVSSCCGEGPPALPLLQLRREPPALPRHRAGAAAGQVPQPSTAGSTETRQQQGSAAQVLFLAIPPMFGFAARCCVLACVGLQLAGCHAG